MTDGHLFNNITLGGRGGTVSSLSLSLYNLPFSFSRFHFTCITQTFPNSKTTLIYFIFVLFYSSVIANYHDYRHYHSNYLFILYIFSKFWFLVTTMEN